MSVRTQTCLVLHCDDCTKPIRDDDTDGIYHFDDHAHLAEALGGKQPDGRWVEGWLSDVANVHGKHYCADCKLNDHTFVPDESPCEHLCLRCGEDRDDHQDVAAARQAIADAFGLVEQAGASNA